MKRRFAARLTLVCYGVIALVGQGLHSWMHDHEHAGDDHPPLSVRVVTGDTPVLASDSHDDCDHDSEHCAICQHHSLGQLFIAAPPVQFVLGACELLSTPKPQTIVCLALFSPAQPRAPPIA